MSTRRDKLIASNHGKGRCRKKFFAVLLVFLLGALLIAALHIAMAETADVLGGDGDFEGTQYSRWRTFSEGGGLPLARRTLRYPQVPMRPGNTLS